MTIDNAGLAPGPNNLITDVPGVLVGQASDDKIKTGVSVITAETAFAANVDIMGGAPGTRETDCLASDRLVDHVDAIVLSGGSALGLDAASGVADALRANGRGFAVGPVQVPIVPAAILFDLLNGGASDWTDNPYRELGRQALQAAASDFQLGSVGAGTGCTTANCKGGMGSASLCLPGGYTVGALAAVNPNGSAVNELSGHFHAASCEFASELGGFGVAAKYDHAAAPRNEKLSAYEKMMGIPISGDGGIPGANTTLVVVATDAPLGKAGLKRLAVAAQDGFARALSPSHTPIDGDIVFALSTADTRTVAHVTVSDQLLLGHAAALCVARAIARGVYEASTAERDILPTWQVRYADKVSKNP